MRQPLLERPRIEVKPLHAVVHFQQLLGLHRARLAAQQDAVRDARRDLGAGQEHGRESRAVRGGAAALEKQTDVGIVLGRG